MRKGAPVNYDVQKKVFTGNLDIRARKLLSRLLACGYQAYIVGGYVRDRLRGEDTANQDVDIATNARPDEVLAVASIRGWPAKTVGVAFGVVQVVVDGRPFEVATFRREGYGEDGHRPEWVEFGDDLTDDLGRRDFTVNAMAMTVDGDLIDPFGGWEDVGCRIIATVGDAVRRFSEDGLRIFRAARLASQLGFAVAPETEAAMASCRDRIAGLSVERVARELDLTVCGVEPVYGLELLRRQGILDCHCRQRRGDDWELVPILPELVALYGCEQNRRYHLLDVWRHTMEVVRMTTGDQVLRWAALLHDVAKGTGGVRAYKQSNVPTDPRPPPVGAYMAGEILTRLRFPHAVKEEIVWLGRHHMSRPIQTPKSLRRWLVKMAGTCAGLSQLAGRLDRLFKLWRADCFANGRASYPDKAELQSIEAAIGQLCGTMPLYPEQLSITGGEIAALCGQSPLVGEIQRELLRMVQGGMRENRPDQLQAAAVRLAAGLVGCANARPIIGHRHG
ncbi:MAG: CCA tRNA nucleotidyltransferase [Negativicutes bacterium]|nr:CCA tRNA nucleotidyltransferase [Negativicutes bacterium]